MMASAVGSALGPLTIGQHRVTFGGFDVDDVCLQRPRIAAKQSVRQRAVAPKEPSQMDPYEEYHKCIEHSVTEVRNLQPAPHQQRPIGERVVEVASDDHPVPPGPFGDDGDHLGGRQPGIGNLAE